MCLRLGNLLNFIAYIYQIRHCWQVQNGFSQENSKFILAVELVTAILEHLMDFNSGIVETFGNNGNFGPMLFSFHFFSFVWKPGSY